jgi:acetylglutamate kinase
VNCVVVKLGGHVLDGMIPDSTVLVDLAHDVAALMSDGTKVVVVHGGGPQIGALLSTVGIESRFFEGLRVTGCETMGYVAMALGHVNLHVVAALNRAGLPSIGLSGADGSVVRATSLGPRWDRAGGDVKVRATGLTPVLSSVAVATDGGLLNCNADTVAGAVAGALNAMTLVLLSDVDQLRADLSDGDSALATVTSAEVHKLIDAGAVRDGMRPKMTAALDALAGGASAVVLANGARRHALRDTLARAIPTTEVVA